MSKNTTLVFSYGIEKILGNASTDTGDSQEATTTNTFFEKLG